MPPLTAEHFALEIVDDNNGDPAALAAANRILERAQDARTLELTVDSPRLPVPPEAVAGTSLTRLVVMAPTSLDAMLGLIRSLPRLTSLGLWRLTLDEIQADISVPAPGEGCVVEPLDTQLKVVSINVNQDQPSWEMVVPVTKYLLLRIPTLAMLKAVHAPKKQIMDFVQQYSEWYPHLKHIDFSLNDSDDPFENRRNGSIIKPFEEPGRRAYF
ncbi:hypothetical protein H4R18_005321 [Coemansia javaensis]|uniref:Uncharacterized protein n=1 Tax=Coemansia javaensis TaxID=2761396 RepID=A0A9W8H8Y1_9FUNG|nr:hypothetical protein H4R18_005321 [Coemansia javaensis]